MSVRLLVLCAVAGAQALAAQDPRLQRLAPEVAGPVSTILDSVSVEDLPPEPIIDRALEGTMKRAAPDRIVAAVRELLQVLRNARSTLGADAAFDEVTAAAGALQVGASAEDIATVAGIGGVGSLAPTYAVMADLLTLGVPRDTVLRTVAEYRRAGGTDRGLLDLQRAIAADVTAGRVPPGAAALLRLREYTATIPRRP